MRPIDRLRRLDPARVDAVLAAALLGLAQAEAWLAPAVAGRRPETAGAAAVMAGALVLRRSHPLLAVLLVAGAFTGLAVSSGLPNAVFLLPCGLVAMYSLGAYAATEASVVGLAITLAALPLGAVRTDDPTVTDLTAPVLLFTAAWAGGRSMSARRRRNIELEDRHAVLLHEQDAREREAMEQERRRIARELHDIVAHRVTTIVIQAESGSATVGDDDLSRQAFAAIADSARQSLDELRTLLGLLREGDGPPETSPPPGAARLDELVLEVRAAGLGVEASFEGELGNLPAGIDLTVYRIVQEALTNALKHGQTRAVVRVACETDRVLVEVRNSVGTSPGPGRNGSGRGLPGMRERVRLYGGEVTARPDGVDWVVHAELPLTGAER